MSLHLVENTTDATRGQPLATRALDRQRELVLALAKLPEGGRARDEIELALSSLSPLLTGDLQHLSDATASEINRWLEHTKHVAEQTPVSSVEKQAAEEVRSDTVGEV